MKAYIYTGGSICREDITERPDKDTLIIAADSGYDNARLLGVSPSVLVGDLDSLRTKDYDCAELIKLPAEKDLSDTQAAVNIALERGADTVVIVGGLDGRLDHTLANLAIIAGLTKKGITAYMTDGRNRVRYISSSSALIARGAYKYLSLIADSEKLRGVTVKGCKYPLTKATLTKDEPSLAISNEIVENCALISIRRGSAYIIESNDKK